MTQEWRWVTGYEGRYEVSNMGGFRSWVANNGRNRSTEGPVVRDASRNTRGYHVVNLYDEHGARRQFRLHCLILEAFVGPRPEGAHGAHDDDNPDNNSLSNLRWKTPKENCEDRDRNGGTAKGERHGRYTHGRYVRRNN